MRVCTIVLILCVVWCATMHRAIAESGEDALEVCSLPMVTGPCRASLRRFGFDATTKTCTTFIYGGCKGNANNFMSQEECNSMCGA